MTFLLHLLIQYVIIVLRYTKGMVMGMPHLSLYTWIFYFFIYAFVGWCVEVSYAAFVHGKFVNRGFLSGPICPIYGFGVCFVVLCLSPLKWWYYSNSKFNLKGYVCLGFSLLWGVGCIAVLYLAHPAVEALVGLIPVLFGRIILAIFLTVFIVDFIGTLAGVLRFKKTISLVHEFDDKLHDISDRIGENISDTVISAIESGKKGEAKLNELKEKYSDKYGERLRAVGDFTELREKYEKLMQRGRSFSAKRILSAFPVLKKDDRIKNISGRVDNFFKKKYGKKKSENFESSGSKKHDNTEDTTDITTDENICSEGADRNSRRDS